MGNVNCNPEKMKNTREICALLEPDARFAEKVPGSPGGEGSAVPTAERSAGVSRRRQKGAREPYGSLAPS